MKGIFYAYVLWPFDKNFFLISTSDFMLFELKTMVKSCLEFYFDIQQAPSELLLTGEVISAFLAEFLVMGGSKISKKKKI